MNLLVIKPRLSEKAYAQSQNKVYIFQVPKDTSKQAIAQAVSAQYEVEVVSVNTMNVGGKTKRTFVNRRGQFVKGERADIKKAYVSLAKGQSIPIFAADEEADTKAEEVAAKTEKKAKKATAKKETK
jgi:large subunit ribosomal protein L23